MIIETKKTTFICPRCDRVYFSISREAWDKDRAGWNEKAYDSKMKHLCPWLRKRKQVEGKR
jgi:hypothetical protein